MGEDNSPLKEAFKTIAGVNDKEEIAEARDRRQSDRNDADVTFREQPSAEALQDEGVEDEISPELPGASEH
jgi:hypothetical protein